MSGLGAEELEQDHAKPDFNRGSGGEPMIPNAETGKIERFARMSSFGTSLEEKSGLNNWLIAKALEGAADRSILARATAASPYEDHKPDWTKLREDAIQAGRGSYKADVGTAVHAMSERWEQEDDYDPGGVFTPALDAYTTVQKALGLKSQLIECQFVNDTMRGAGTADRLYELRKPLVAPDGTVLPTGTLIIGDLKTGSSLEFSAPGYAVQLAGYAGGTLYDVVHNTRLPTPPINQDWAIIMHLDVETAHCEFVWVDLEVGRFGAALAEEVREWRRNWRRKEGYKAAWLPVKVYDPDAEPEVEEAKPLDKMSKAELLTEADRLGIKVKAAWNKPEILEHVRNGPAPEVPPEAPLASPDEVSPVELTALVDWCRARLEVIRLDPPVLRWFQERWPKGLRPPKAIETIEQLKELDSFISRTESHWQLAFIPAPTPRHERRAR